MPLWRNARKPEDGRLIYLGQASPLAWLMHHPDNGKEIFHITTPNKDAEAYYNSTDHHAWLREQRGLLFALSDLQHQLLEAFFTRFLPIWPMLHKSTFNASCRSKDITLRLIHSVPFICSLHTVPSVLEQQDLEASRKHLNNFTTGHE